MSHAADDKHLRQQAILRQLEATYPAGTTLARIVAHLAVADQPVPEERVVRDLQELMQEGRVTQTPSPFSPALKYYFITEAGIASL